MFIFIQDIAPGISGVFLTSIFIFDDYRLLPSLDFCRVVKVKGFRQSSSGIFEDCLSRLPTKAPKPKSRFRMDPSNDDNKERANESVLDRKIRKLVDSQVGLLLLLLVHLLT